QAGTDTPVFVAGETTFAGKGCENIWDPAGPTAPPAPGGARPGGEHNGPPLPPRKGPFRERVNTTRAPGRTGVGRPRKPAGGAGGASLIVNERGECVARGLAFEEDFVVADLDLEAVFRARLHDSRRRKEKLRVRDEATRISLPALPRLEAPTLPPREVAAPALVEEGFGALVLGTRDYVRKDKIKRVVVGLSGGIDSSLVAAIAVEALGRDNVAGVGMPSAFSSAGTRRDAQRLAKNLGIEFLTIPITPLLNAYRRALGKAFKGLKEDVTEENIQARIRGNLLMALSNKFGWLVLTTRNQTHYTL